MTDSEIFAKILIDGELTEGPIVAGDYTLGVRDIEGGHQIVIVKGGQTQTLDVLDGLPGARGPEGPAGQDGQPGQDGQDGSDGQDGVSPTVDVDEITGGHRVTITDADGAHVFDVMDGEAGPQGSQGPAGQDAVVDATLTQSGQAADAKATGDEIGQIKDALSELPKSISVGGVALTPDADGDVALPIATASQNGLMMVGAGLTANASGKVGINAASNTSIDRRSDERPICADVLDYAVRAGLLSNSQITDADKPQICQTIGAEPAKGAWVLKGTLTTGNKDIGVSVDLNGCTELIVWGQAAGTGNSTLTTNISSLVYQFAVNGERRTYAHYVDSLLGIEPVVGKYDLTSTQQYLASVAATYAWTDGTHIASINKILFQTPQNVTECEVSIYAR